jgi:hypothetical protein
MRTPTSPPSSSRRRSGPAQIAASATPEPRGRRSSPGGRLCAGSSRVRQALRYRRRRPLRSGADGSFRSSRLSARGHGPPGRPAPPRCPAGGERTEDADRGNGAATAPAAMPQPNLPVGRRVCSSCLRTMSTFPASSLATIGRVELVRLGEMTVRAVDRLIVRKRVVDAIVGRSQHVDHLAQRCLSLRRPAWPLFPRAGVRATLMQA